MKQEDFIKHACEQVLRFTQVENWHDLTEKTKVQLGFNMGVVSLGLSLSKEDGYMTLADVCSGNTSMSAFRGHLLQLIDTHKIPVDAEQIARPF
jgi:hypothetical protein